MEGRQAAASGTECCLGEEGGLAGWVAVDLVHGGSEGLCALQGVVVFVWGDGNVLVGVWNLVQGQPAGGGLMSISGVTVSMLVVRAGLTLSRAGGW